MTNSIQPKLRSINFDEAISLTEYGRFHYQIIIVSALCLLSAGFQNGLSAYVFQAAQYDLGLNSAQIGLLNALFLIGGTCSAFLWGIMADSAGRKIVLLTTLLLDFAVVLVSSFAQNFVALGICRFLNGFLIGAPGCLTFSYLGEFHSPKLRAKSICYSGIFFTSTWLLLPIVAKIILPLELNWELPFGLSYKSWGLFLVILSLPELIAGIWLIFLPETPKFLLARGDNEEALKILRKMFCTNTRKSPEEFPVGSLIDDSPAITVNFQCGGKISRIVEDIIRQMKYLCKAPLIFLTALTSMIMFSNMFGYFGLGLWLPELLKRFQNYELLHPNVTTTITDLANFQNISENPFDEKIFESTLSVGICCLLGNVLSGYLAGKLAQRTIPLATMMIGGLSAGSIYWLRSSDQNLAVSCIFLAAMATGNMALGSVAVEIFPTNVSAMAICIATCAGRIGAICSSIVFGLLMDEKCEIPIFLVSVVLILGGFLCIFIPNYAYKKNEEKVSKLEISVISL